MKKRIIRRISFCAAVLMLLSVLCACGTGGENTKTTAEATSAAALTADTTAAESKNAEESVTAADNDKTSPAKSDVSDDDTEQPDSSSSQSRDYLKTKLFVRQIKIGWNLGNTLEANSARGGSISDSYTVNDFETAWGNPAATKKQFDTVRSAGFNAVRIPVSWGKFVTESGGKYTVRTDLLQRVKEVVDYAYSEGMFVIVNMHHDDKDWLDISATDSFWAKIKTKYAAIWQQIASYFKDYGERLILEGANEPVSLKSADGGNKEYDWWGSLEGLTRVNELNELFVNTVRKTGGKNSTRYLMIPTYGAQINMHQVASLAIPNDDKRIIVDVHWYTESTNADDISYTLEQLADYGEEREIVYILGECGIQASNDDATKIKWAGVYINTASSLGLRCFLWDDGGNYAILDRNNCLWNSTAFVNALIENAVNQKLV